MNQVTDLLNGLAEEIDQKRRCEIEEFLSELYLFVHKRDEYDADNLITKLESAGRETEIRQAKIALERFVWLLETYQHFPSGQKLLGLFLVQIHDVFCYQILGKGLSDDEIDNIIQEKIVDKTIADMGKGFRHFTLTPRHVRGMVYFLAEKCFIRWDEKCSA